MTTETQPRPEAEKVPSQFQELQGEIERLDKDHPSGVAWTKEDREKRAQAKDQRDKLIKIDSGAQRALREAQNKINKDGWVERITTAEDPVEEIRKIRSELQANRDEDGIVNSVAVKRLWDSQKTGGLVTYYFNRALDRLEARCLMVKGGRILPSDERPLEKEDLFPLRRAPWEWRIPDDFGERFQKAEQLKDPETAEGWVVKIQNETYDFLKTAIEKKLLLKQLKDESERIEAMIERIPTKIGQKDEFLSERLATDYPEGIYLKEKLELFFKAMKHLAGRTVEVVKAEGSLVKLSATQERTQLAEDIMISLTNLELKDFYVLTHLHQLFPESINVSETQPDLQRAWDEYKKQLARPFAVRDDGKVVLKKLRTAENEEFAEGWAVKDFFSNQGVETVLRKEIAEYAGDEGDEEGMYFVLNKKGLRSELLAWCLLKIGLTFDMWDRQRWKQLGKGEARDLMWFDWKRKLRLKAGRSGEGIPRVVGRTWAYEEQDSPITGPDRDRMGRQAELIEKILKENKQRAIFSIRRLEESRGTIIGDFWNSACIVDHGELRPLSSYLKLEDIPFLTAKAEEELYSGYFGYSIAMAGMVTEYLAKMDWKPEELVSSTAWKGITDQLERMTTYCPWINALSYDLEGQPIFSEKQKDKAEYEIKQRFAEIIALGIFWYFSYLNQPRERIIGLSVIPKAVLTTDQFQKIMDTMKLAGFLDENHFGQFLYDIRECNIRFRAASKPPRR